MRDGININAKYLTTCLPLSPGWVLESCCRAIYFRRPCLPHLLRSEMDCCAQTGDLLVVLGVDVCEDMVCALASVSRVAVLPIVNVPLEFPWVDPRF